MGVYDVVHFNDAVRFWCYRSRAFCKTRVHTGINDNIILKTINDQTKWIETIKN